MKDLVPNDQRLHPYSYRENFSSRLAGSIIHQDVHLDNKAPQASTICRRLPSLARYGRRLRSFGAECNADVTPYQLRCSFAMPLSELPRGDERKSVKSLFACSWVQCYNTPAMDQLAFEALVAEALENLPEDISAWLDNVAIVVAEWPTPQHLAQAGIGPGQLLFGLYVGVPKTHRGFTYGEILPDKILIFQRPIERVCRSPASIRDCVRRTVLHEIGHHFGMDEDQLRAAGV